MILICDACAWISTELLITRKGTDKSSGPSGKAIRRLAPVMAI
jgi:hypothetical protein